MLNVYLKISDKKWALSAIILHINTYCIKHIFVNTYN